MDTGLNFNHLDISSHRSSICGANFVYFDPLVDDENLWVDAGMHGTHVTGTIVGNGAAQPRYAGMATPLVRHIRFAKVLSHWGSGNDIFILRAWFSWERLERRIEPFYPKAGRGRRPYPLRSMLRVHCVQLVHDLRDPGMEYLLYEVESVRRFAGLRLSGPLPDETTIPHFRHLLERHSLGPACLTRSTCIWRRWATG